ncbi:MAG: ATP-binding protein [Chloroflexi bacterium]|nr:ATP-binding protein [Chloroflexota bacterium]
MLVSLRGQAAKGRAPGWIADLSLQQRIVALVTLGIVTMLGLFVVLGTQALQQTTERILKERLVMAELVSRHIDQVLHEGTAQLEAIGQSDAIDLEDGDLEPEKRLLKEVHRQLTIFTYGFSLLDRQGNVLWTEPYDADAIGTSRQHYRHIQQSLETNTCSVSNLVMQRGVQWPIISLDCPIRDRRGEVSGTLEGSIDLTHPSIGGFVSPLALGETGYADLIDENGVVLASTLASRAFDTVDDHRDRLRVLIKEQRTTMGTCHSCHESGRSPAQDILVFAPLTAAHWGVAIRQSEMEALAPTRDLQYRVIMLGIGSLVVALFLAWLTTEGVLRPVRILTGAAESIASGNLAGAVPIRGTDEIGTLGRTFDTMRQRLKSSLEEIKGWNSELEARVLERSSELERKYRELSALNTIATTVSEPISLEVILERSLETVLDLTGADAGGIMMWDHETDSLVYRIHRGLSQSYLQGVAGLKPGEGIAGRAFQSGRPIVVDDLSEDPRLTRTVVRREGIGSFASIPLRARDEVLGVLNVASLGKRRFGPEDTSLFVAIGSQVGMAIENSRLLDEAAKVQAFRELDRLRSQLLSTVSHELRTPLSVIKGHATALLSRTGEHDERTQRRYLRIIDEESNRLTGLIDDLLDMSRIEAGALRLYKHPVSLVAVARKVAGRIRLQSRKHRFVQEFPADFPLVAADERRLEQVLQNLVENAVKYSPKGGRVQVWGTTAGDMVVVSVQDEGEGIRQQEQERVFEPFYRGESSATSTTRGTGLGLAICKGIVEAHGGRIWVESTVHVGSTFSFSLPVLTDCLQNQDESASSGIPDFAAGQASMDSPDGSPR